MIHINLFGGGFQHAASSTLNKKSKYIVWDYNSTKNDTTFFVDDYIANGLNKKYSKYEYGWLLESKFITPKIIDFCINNVPLLKNKYIKIFTHNKNLLALDADLFVFCPANGTWIDDLYVRNKTKNISMIASNKVITEGHKIRLEIAKKYSSRVDLYGRGFKEIDKKEEGLEDYMFSICIENGVYESYFTEKILDCFACGTMPVYLGTPDIFNYFNKDGIVFLDNEFDINYLNTELYLSKTQAIQDNLERVKKYITCENWLYENYFKE